MSKVNLHVDFRTTDLNAGDAMTATNLFKLFELFRDYFVGDNVSGGNPNSDKLDADNFLRGSITERELDDSTACINNAAMIKDRTIPSTAIAKKSIGDTQVADSAVQIRCLTIEPLLLQIWSLTGPASASAQPPKTIYKTNFPLWPSMFLFSIVDDIQRSVVVTAGSYLWPGNGSHNTFNKTLEYDQVGGVVAGGVIVRNAQGVWEGGSTVTGILVIHNPKVAEFYP